MNIFETKKIYDNFYIIAERISPKMICSMGLIIGDKKAVIVDTGFGVTGALRKHVETLTDKPVICLLTHGDPDHAGGAALFDTIYMSVLDGELLPNALNADKRISDVYLGSHRNQELVEYMKTHMVSNESFQHQDIHEGDLFDLGGVKLEAFPLPGHSKGSFCFLNREDGYALTGDSVAAISYPMLLLPRCTSLVAYAKALRNFYDATGEKMLLYSGHLLDPFPHGFIPDVLRGCEEIFAGDTESGRPATFPFEKVIGEGLKPMEHFISGSQASVRYNGMRIY
jgi:hydroxyacylglutathione hydrolase